MYVLDLNKTKMHILIKMFREDVPSLKKCGFSHYRRTYWMDYYDKSGHPVHVVVQNHFGETKILFTDKKERKDSFYKVDSAFLLDNHMVSYTEKTKSSSIGKDTM